MADEAPNIKVRIASCEYLNNWLTTQNNDTKWHGMDAQSLKNMPLPDYELVWDVPPRNWTWEGVQAVYNELVDMDAQFYAINWRRYQYVDFSPAFRYTDIVIQTLKSVNMKSRVFEGVFDHSTYGLIIATVVLSTLVKYILVKSTNKVDVQLCRLG